MEDDYLQVIFVVPLYGEGSILSVTYLSKTSYYAALRREVILHDMLTYISRNNLSAYYNT